jgi:hypothetical protein
MVCRLFIANVPFDATREEITDHLETVGLLHFLELFEDEHGSFRG